MKIYIYYRHTSNHVVKNRPSWFSFENCWKNLLNTTHKRENIDITLALDGDINDDFTKNYRDRFTLFPTNYSSSLISYRDLLEHIKGIQMDKDDLIYFVENDYLHIDNWVDKVIDLFSCYKTLNYVSLYDHNDKYISQGYDSLVSKIITSETHHWRTTPSTCGTFIITRDLFDKDVDVWENTVGDHNTFMYLNQERQRYVLTPIPGLATHCMDGLLSPTIDWESIEK
jgi:hypothetical protein|tara:strand:+ start:387 stop:1067 length:681 start_codon:yes stop_codon:yes gene_type:complete